MIAVRILAITVAILLDAMVVIGWLYKGDAPLALKVVATSIVILANVASYCVFVEAGK